MSSRNEKMSRVAEELAHRTQRDTAVRRETQRRYQEQARELAGRYHHECQEHLPAAQKAFSQVVVPWWSDLHDSGLANQLTSILQNRPSALPASDEVPFFWPDEALAELEHGDNAYAWVLQTKHLVPGSGMPGIELRDQQRMRRWKAQLLLQTGESGLEPLLARRIDGARGLAVGYLHQSLRLPIELTPGSALPDIHTLVILDLAKQIESGIVEDRVCTSLLELR